MRKIGKFIGCCLVATSLLACTVCSGLDRLSDSLKDGAEQLRDDVVIGKSNALKIVRIGNAIRISKRSFDEWLESLDL